MWRSFIHSSGQENIVQKRQQEGARAWSLALQHEGIIVKAVSRWWPKLPIYVRAYYEMEDMLNDVRAYVILKQDKWDPRRGASSTFVWHLAHNYCYVVLNREFTAKRIAMGGIFPLEQASKAAVPDEGLRLRESRKAVERMIQFANAEVQEALNDLLLAHSGKCKTHLRNPQLLQDARSIAVQHSVQADDFRRVMSHLV